MAEPVDDDAAMDEIEEYMRANGMGDQLGDVGEEMEGDGDVGEGEEDGALGDVYYPDAAAVEEAVGDTSPFSGGGVPLDDDLMAALAAALAGVPASRVTREVLAAALQQVLAARAGATSGTGGGGMDEGKWEEAAPRSSSSGGGGGECSTPAAAAAVITEDGGGDTEVTYEVGRETLLGAVYERDTERVRHILEYGHGEVTPRVYRAAQGVGDPALVALLVEYADMPESALAAAAAALPPPPSLSAAVAAAVAADATVPRQQTAIAHARLRHAVEVRDAEQVRALLETAAGVAGHVTERDVAAAAALYASVPTEEETEILRLLAAAAAPGAVPPHGTTLPAALAAAAHATASSHAAPSHTDAGSLADAVTSHAPPLTIDVADTAALGAVTHVVAAGLPPEDVRDGGVTPVLDAPAAPAATAAAADDHVAPITRPHVAIAGDSGGGGGGGGGGLPPGEDLKMGIPTPTPVRSPSPR